MATSPVQTHDPEIAQLLAEQKTGIGGSEVFHLYNEREFGKGCERWLMYKKTGYAEDSPEDSTKKEGIFRRGRKMEPIIAEEYELATGRKVRRQPVRRNPDYSWALVHMDRQIIAGSGTAEWNIKETAALEIKSFGEWAFRKMVQDKSIRKATLFQGLHTMLVTGYKITGFAGMNVGDFDLRPFDIPRDEELIDDLKRRGDAFWNAKEKAGELGDNPIPQLEDEKDIRCLTCTYAQTCRGQAADLSLRAVVEGKKQLIQITNPELVQDLRDCDEVKQSIKEQSEILDNIKASIGLRLGEVEAASVIDYGTVYFKGKPYSSFNSKAFAEEWKALSSDVKAYAAAIVSDDQAVKDALKETVKDVVPLAIEMAKFIAAVDYDKLLRQGMSERFVLTYPKKEKGASA
jgi:predicted phage-related endonuclease